MAAPGGSASVETFEVWTLLLVGRFLRRLDDVGVETSFDQLVKPEKMTHP